MKTKNLFWAATAILGMAFTSCSDSDDGFTLPNDSPVKATFTSMYPSVTNVTWEQKSTYYVADFRLDALETEAWYDGTTGIWYMTETDIPFSALPAAVQTAFNTSEYADWKVDDVDMLQRKDMETVYVIEVEKNNAEYDLYYSADGTLIKAILDNDNSSWNYLPNELPSAISTYITTNYPNARIVETEIESNGTIEVDIINGTTHLELLFTSAGEWIYTKQELTIAAVPANILEILNASYPSWEIDDVDYFETAESGNFYLFELEQGNIDKYVKITVAGEMSEVTATNF